MTEVRTRIERRQSSRIRIFGDLHGRVIQLDVLVVLRDIGAGGFAIESPQMFHAGTELRDGQLVVTGGRVLCVTALGETVRFAQHRAYQAVEGVQFAGAQFRRDIGWRAIRGRPSTNG